MKLFLTILFLTLAEWASAQTQIPDNLAAMLFVEQGSAKLPNAATLCLEVDGKDVNSSLLDLLRQKDDRFVVGSECQRVSAPWREGGGSYHKQTGKPAFFISVSKFRIWGNNEAEEIQLDVFRRYPFLRPPFVPRNNEAEIQLDIFHHGLWGDYKTLLVQEVEGRWSVIKVLRSLSS